MLVDESDAKVTVFDASLSLPLHYCPVESQTTASSFTYTHTQYTVANSTNCT